MKFCIDWNSEIAKAFKNRAHLVRTPKQVIRNGKAVMTYVWINPEKDQKKGRKASKEVTNKSKTPSDKQLDNLYFEAIKKGDMEEVQRLVDIKATSYASGTFTDFEADNPCYKIRRGKTPEHTIKVYKKASTVDGNFVTLFVGGSSPIRVPIGIWLDAVPGYKITDPVNGREYIPVKDKMVWNPKKNCYDRKKMGNRTVEVTDEQAKELEKLGFHVTFSKKGSDNKSGKVRPGHWCVTCLANRPGWHLGEYPIMGQAGTKVNGQNVNNPNDVYYEVEIPDPKYFKYQAEADSNPEKDIKYMPENGSYKHITQVNKKSVTGDWYIAGCIKVIKPMTEAEVNTVLDAHKIPRQGWSDGEGGIGELDLEKIHVNINETDKFKKLRDPITYDDNGDIIPLSQRFNMNSDDVRKSF